MKKTLLTGLVVASFIIYSFHQRNDGSSAIIKPPSAPAASQAAAAPSSNNSSSSPAGSATTQTAIAYKDGQYTGSSDDAYYGFIQVLAVISGSKLTDVRFLQYPNDQPNSIVVNSQAMPFLKQEALQAQSANVNIVSGATDTSQAFIQSLSSALDKAKS
jgi:uncharacterized protein with FMN-binding domain